MTVLKDRMSVFKHGDYEVRVKEDRRNGVTYFWRNMKAGNRPVKYPIYWTRLTKLNIVGTLHHTSQKAWFSGLMVHDLIERASRYHNFRIYEVGQ